MSGFGRISLNELCEDHWMACTRATSYLSPYIPPDGQWHSVVVTGTPSTVSVSIDNEVAGSHLSSGENEVKEEVMNIMYLTLGIVE